MKLRIGIDVDDVVADLHEVWAHRLYEKFGKAGDPSEWRRYDFWLDFGLTAEEAYSVLTPDIYDEVQPVDGALNAARIISGLGHEILFVTSCHTVEAFEAKVWWLNTKRFAMLAHQITPVGSWTKYQKKYQVPMDWLIDDHIGNFDRFDGYKVLVTRPHNAREEFIGKRVKSLAEAAQILESIHRDQKAARTLPVPALDFGGVTGIEGRIAKEEHNTFAGISATPLAVSQSKDTNPKDAIGMTKVPLHFVSGVVKAYDAIAHYLGNVKYGAWNYRAGGARASVYRAALERHMDRWWEGEELDSVDETPHLANAKACINILIECQEYGNLVDDRPPSRAKVLARVYDKFEKLMVKIQERYKDRNPKHFTIADTPLGQ